MTTEELISSLSKLIEKDPAVAKMKVRYDYDQGWSFIEVTDAGLTRHFKVDGEFVALW